MKYTLRYDFGISHKINNSSLKLASGGCTPDPYFSHPLPSLAPISAKSRSAPAIGTSL